MWVDGKWVGEVWVMYFVVFFCGEDDRIVLVGIDVYLYVEFFVYGWNFFEWFEGVVDSCVSGGVDVERCFVSFFGLDYEFVKFIDLYFVFVIYWYGLDCWSF